MRIDQIAHFLTLLGTGILGAGLTGLGLVCFIAPAVAADAFGLPMTALDTRAWVYVCGARDLCIGIMFTALLLSPPSRPALRIVAPVLTALPIADALITYGNSGNVAGAAAHVAGTFCIAVLSICAWLDPALDARTKQN
jgi:hypothetical protein